MIIPDKTKDLLKKNLYQDNIIQNVYNNSLAFFTSQVVFYLLKSKIVKRDFFDLIQKYCRFHLLNILKSKNISNKYKAVIAGSALNIRLVYKVLKNKFN